MRDLVTFEQAISLIEKVSHTIGTEEVSLNFALGRVLAQDVFAVEDHPRFANSSVDGYALGSIDSPLTICAVIPAGIQGESLKTGEAARIFTGAPIPVGTVAIVKQEDAEVNGSALRFLSDHTSFEHFVRPQGGDFKAGDLLLPRGTTITPGAISLLAGQGIVTVVVANKVHVGILCTGNELVPAEQVPQGAQIRNSNAPMLVALLEQLGCVVIDILTISDTFEATYGALETLSAKCDLIVSSGGVSVGDYDHLASVGQQGWEVLFHGVRMKPGQPVLLACCKNTFLAGLPGNPASGFVCFHLFVKSLVRRINRQIDWQPKFVTLKVGTKVEAPAIRDEFIRARLIDGVAFPYGDQTSSGLISLAHAESLIRVHAGTKLDAGEFASCIIL